MPLTPATATQDIAHDEPQDYLWTLNFGPQHPATHTTLRLVLKLDGERVMEAMPDIGYLHSGFEKLGEHLDYNQYVTVTDRMNYISPLANNVARWRSCWDWSCRRAASTSARLFASLPASATTCCATARWG